LRHGQIKDSRCLYSTGLCLVYHLPPTGRLLVTLDELCCSKSVCRHVGLQLPVPGSQASQQARVPLLRHTVEYSVCATGCRCRHAPAVRLD